MTRFQLNMELAWPLWAEETLTSGLSELEVRQAVEPLGLSLFQDLDSTGPFRRRSSSTS